MKIDVNDFLTHNDVAISATGTSLRGYLVTSYANLVSKLGQPSEFYDNYKSDAEWRVSWYDGDMAAIYNYKDGKNYCGSAGLETKDITLWHISGLTGSAGLARLEQMFSNVEMAYKIGMRGH